MNGAAGLGVRARTGTGEVERVGAAEDVGLGGLGTVAAGDLLGRARRVVEVRVGATGVDLARRLVGVAGPSAGLAGDRRVTDGHDPRRADVRTVGGDGSGGDARDACDRCRGNEPDDECERTGAPGPSQHDNPLRSCAVPTGPSESDGGRPPPQGLPMSASRGIPRPDRRIRGVNCSARGRRRRRARSAVWRRSSRSSATRRGPERDRVLEPLEVVEAAGVEVDRPPRRGERDARRVGEVDRAGDAAVDDFGDLAAVRDEPCPQRQHGSLALEVQRQMVELRRQWIGDSDGLGVPLVIDAVVLEERDRLRLADAEVVRAVRIVRHRRHDLGAQHFVPETHRRVHVGRHERDALDAFPQWGLGCHRISLLR